VHWPCDPHTSRLYVVEAGPNVALLVQTVYELHATHRLAGAGRPAIVGICSEAAVKANSHLCWWLIGGHAALLCLLVPGLHKDWPDDLANVAVRVMPDLAYPDDPVEETLSTALAPELRMTWQEQAPASLLIQVGQWLEGRTLMEDALRFYRAAHGAAPTDAYASCCEGRLLNRQGRYSEALNALERAVGIGPDHAPTSYLAACAAAACGDRPAARRHAEHALRQDPRHTGACTVLLRLYAEDSDWARLIEATEACPAVLAGHEAKLLAALASGMIGDRAQARRLFEAVSATKRRWHAALAERVRRCIGLKGPDEQ
jgi:tetratricopeptide (TPR) repeat protein